MPVSLQKGQRVNLTKEDGNALTQVVAGLGWDRAASGRANIDCDASAILCGGDGKIIRQEDIVYFGSLKHPSDAVRHNGDNLTGAGDDEQIEVNLSDIPGQYEKIVFIVTIYQAKERKQHFGMIRNAFIRIVDRETRKEILRYDLSENCDGMTAMIFAEMYRKEGRWKFNAVGQPTQDNGLSALAERYR
ncbi:MAG: TerD family protein [Treponema sp.]|jgi:stress response protein SCP2|nr:TerD family protein [Treponema sp.]